MMKKLFYLTLGVPMISIPALGSGCTDTNTALCDSGEWWAPEISACVPSCDYPFIRGEQDGAPTCSVKCFNAFRMVTNDDQNGECSGRCDTLLVDNHFTCNIDKEACLYQNVCTIGDLCPQGQYWAPEINKCVATCDGAFESNIKSDVRTCKAGCDGYVVRSNDDRNGECKEYCKSGERSTVTACTEDGDHCISQKVCTIGATEDQLCLPGQYYNPQIPSCLDSCDEIFDHGVLNGTQTCAQSCLYFVVKSDNSQNHECIDFCDSLKFQTVFACLTPGHFCLWQDICLK